MNRRDMERYEAMEIRSKANQLVKETSDKEIRLLYEAMQDYKKIKNLKDMLREFVK